MLARVASLPAASINPGTADPAAFRHVAYKGGSDVGAINLTTVATTKRGTELCFSATVNDPSRALDDAGVEAAYGGVLRLLAHD